MTTLRPARATVLVLATLLLAPVATAALVVAPTQAAQPADLERRAYVAVAAGNLDATLGDLLVLTTADCSKPGCPRDVWFRFLNTVTEVPRVGDTAGYAEHLGARASGCAATPPATLVAAVQNGCWRPERATPGFHDLPLAVSALDETRAFTDGRYVVYAAGPVGGPYDVYRFDARNPSAGSVLVNASAADETPFGVAGDMVGVRVAKGDGTVDLVLVDLAPGAPDRRLANVAATASAVMTATRVAWSTGSTLVSHAVASGERIVLDENALFSDLAASGDRLVFIRSRVCTPAPADPTCNTRSSPPQVHEVRVLPGLADAQSVAFGPAGCESVLGSCVMSTVDARPHRPSVLVAHRPLVGTPGPVGQTLPLTTVFWLEQPLGGASRETIRLYDNTNLVGPGTTGAPCAWSQADLPPGTFGTPALSRNYIAQIDFRAAGTTGCPATNPGANVALYAYAQAQVAGR